MEDTAAGQPPRRPVDIAGGDNVVASAASVAPRPPPIDTAADASAAASAPSCAAPSPSPSLPPLPPQADGDDEGGGMDVAAAIRVALAGVVDAPPLYLVRAAQAST